MQNVNVTERYRWVRSIFVNDRGRIVREAATDNYLSTTIRLLSGLEFNRVYNLLGR